MDRSENRIDAWLDQWPRAVAWLPLISLVLTATLALYLLERFVVCSAADWRCAPHVPAVSVIGGVAADSARVPLSELSGRSTWALSALVFTMTLAAALIVGGYGVWRTFRHRPFVLFAAVVVTVLAAAALFEVLPTGDPFVLSDTVLERTVYVITQAALVVTGVEILAAAGFAVVAIALTGALDLSFRVTATGGTAEDRVVRLSKYQRLVQSLLIVSAIALAAGSLEASALYSWAGTMIQPAMVPVSPDSSIAYFDGGDALARTMGPLVGTFYTIMLAAVFVPALVLMRIAARRLAWQELGDTALEPQLEKWLEERAILASVPRQLGATLAVFAPLIAGGPLSAILQALAA